MLPLSLERVAPARLPVEECGNEGFQGPLIEEVIERPAGGGVPNEYDRAAYRMGCQLEEEGLDPGDDLPVALTGSEGLFDVQDAL